jgi:hypothetical protein
MARFVLGFTKRSQEKVHIMLVAPVIENDGNVWISVAARQRWRW